MNAQPAPLHRIVRRLSPADLDRVIEIERAAYPYPWTRGIFSDCIRVGYDCWGLQLGDMLVAYSIHNCAAGEAHLLNLCVEPQWQRRGLGGTLLDHVIRRAAARGCRSVFLEVRRSNPAGIALYVKRGFQIVGERSDYYRSDEGREDAIVMRLELCGSERPGFTQRDANS